MKRKYVLRGLDCPNCSAMIEREVGQLEGVSSSSVNLMRQTLTVVFEPSLEPTLTQRIEEIVFSHEPDVAVLEDMPSENGHDHGHDHAHGHGNERSKLIRIAVGAAIYIPSFLAFYFLDLPQYAELALMLVAYVILGADVLYAAARNITKGRVFDENLLMAIATIGAFAIGEFPEAVAVMLFYQVGEYFQDLAVRRSRNSITALMDIRPDTARVLRDDAMVDVHPDDVKVGEVILVRPGERIPLDGVVVSGECLADTKAITGEPVPRRLKVGDEALSGCICTDGALEIRVVKPYGESTVARIIDMVENASSKKARTENLITRFARYYTPAVVAAAAVLAIVPPLFFGGIWDEWIHRALVFLVVSCPCALVISVPLTFFGGIGAASRHGVLVKGGNYLEALNKVDTIVFDKTGTLTEGVFEVTEVIPASGYGREDVISLAASAEGMSNHPIARSIMAECSGKDVPSSRGYEEVAGKGVRAIVDGRKVCAGNGHLMDTEGVQYERCDIPGTKVYVSDDGAYVGCIVISDRIKKDSREAISAVKGMGVRRTMMLTGDDEGTARSVAESVGLDGYRAGLLPDQKVSELEDICQTAQGTVAFVGDGINDAPALSRADVGIAMGGLGSDAAIEAADVVLMTDEPSKLVDAIRVSRSTRIIALENIVFALAVKVLFLALGAAGIVGMWEAVFADVGVALIAVVNAMRILRK